MKKAVVVIVASLLACLAAFAVSGCSSSAAAPTPTDVTRSALEAIKAQDFDTLQKYYVGNAEDLDVTEMAGTASGMDLSAYSDEEKAMVEQFVKVTTDFDYELGAETIDGSKATVEATITTYDLGTAFSEAMADLFTQALTSAFSGGQLDESAMISAFVDSFKAKVDAQSEKTHVATTTFNLVQENGEWKIENLTEDNVDCIMGGMLTGVNNMMDSLASMNLSGSTDSAAAAA